MNKAELEELQARLFNQARKVMRSGHWVDPRETVVVYKVGRTINSTDDDRETEPWPGNPEMVSDECWAEMLDEAAKAGHYINTVKPIMKAE